MISSSVVEAAVRQVVAAAAPEELPLLQPAVEASRDQESRDRGPRRPSGSVGFGVDEATLAQTLTEVAAAASGNLVSAAGIGAGVWWARRLRWRRSAAVAPARVLDAEWQLRLREAVTIHGEAAGLSPELRDMFTDALIGSMINESAKRPPREESKGQQP